MKKYRFISDGMQRFVYDEEKDVLYKNEDGLLIKAKFGLVLMSKFCPYAEIYDESNILPKEYSISKS